MPNTELITIKRGKYAPNFQLVRAWLSAASALISIDTKDAITAIDDAIVELKLIRTRLNMDMLKQEGSR